MNSSTLFHIDIFNSFGKFMAKYRIFGHKKNIWQTNHLLSASMLNCGAVCINCEM